MSAYRIYPICLGFNETAEKSAFTYRKDCGTKMKAAFLVYLVVGEGHYILVDSGGPNPEMAAGMSYPHLSDARYLKKELQLRGVSCDQIDAVILTHLHWDHCYNLDLFPQADVYVQKTELKHAVDPTPFDRYFYVATPGEGLPGWMTAFARLVRLDGEAELFPGIRVFPTPGHSPGQMSVEVATAEGTYLIASDLLPLFENYEQGVPNGITLSFADWYESYEKVRAMNVKILPGHDPRVLEREVYG